MIVRLNEKLRSILSINIHCLKQAFQKRILPKENQQHPSKIYLVFQQQPQNLFSFLLSPSWKHWQFLRPKAFKKLLQSSLHAQKATRTYQELGRTD